MKPYAKHFYKSSAWRKCRDNYFMSQHGLCERCESVGLIVHHKIYISPTNINDPSITLNPNNLELLCQTCHNREHLSNGYGIVRDDVMFDSEGNLIKRG